MLVLEHNGEQLPLNIDDKDWYIVHKYDGKDELHFEMDSAHEMRPLLAEQAAVRTMSDEPRNCNQFLIKNIDEHSNLIVVDCDLDLTAWTDAHIHRIGSPVHEYEDAKLCYEEMAGVLGIASVLEEALEEDLASSSEPGTSVTLRGYTKTLITSTRKSNDRMRAAIADITVDAALENSLAQKDTTIEQTAVDAAAELDQLAENLEEYLGANLSTGPVVQILINILQDIQSEEYGIPKAQPSMLALRNHLQSITEITLTQALLNVRPTGAECAQWGLAVMPQVNPTAKHALLAENGNLLMNMTPLSLLDRIAEIWGLVVNYNVVGHSVLILDPALAGDSGDLYMQDLNVSKIEYTGNSRDLITCMYGYGKKDPETGENLTFASVNQGIPYIENHAYSNKRIVGVFEDVGIDDPTDLYNATYAKLLEVCNPVQNFDIGVNEIGAGAAMYKTAMVTMPTGVRVKHMIVEWKEYPDAEDLSTITLNKVAPSMTDEWKKIKHDDGILIEDINSDVTEDVEVGNRNNDDGILIAKDSEGTDYHKVDKNGVQTGIKMTDTKGNDQKTDEHGNHYTAIYNGALNKEEMVIGDKVNDLKADIDIYGDINVEGSITLNGEALPGGGNYVEYVESSKTTYGTTYDSYKANMGKGHGSSGAPPSGYHIDKRVEDNGYVSEELKSGTVKVDSTTCPTKVQNYYNKALKIDVPMRVKKGLHIDSVFDVDQSIKHFDDETYYDNLNNPGGGHLYLWPAENYNQGASYDTSFRIWGFRLGLFVDPMGKPILAMCSPTGEVYVSDSFEQVTDLSQYEEDPNA